MGEFFGEMFPSLSVRTEKLPCWVSGLRKYERSLSRGIAGFRRGPREDNGFTINTVKGKKNGGECLRRGIRTNKVGTRSS